MGPKKRESIQDLVGTTFMWGYFVLSFTRPQDWMSDLSRVPMAKIASVLAVLAILLSFQQFRWPLPRNAFWLLLLMGQFFATVPMSPVWPGGGW